MYRRPTPKEAPHFLRDMEIPVSLRHLFTGQVSLLHREALAPHVRNPELRALIDEMGRRSAVAQGLYRGGSRTPAPVTIFSQLAARCACAPV